MRHFRLATISSMTFALGFFLCPAQAQAACEQWSMPTTVWLPSKTQINQSNNAFIFIETKPVEGGFLGYAQNIYTVDKDGSYHSVHPWEYSTYRHSVGGILEGAIEGPNVHFTIHWGADEFRKIPPVTGVYTGTVGPQGRLTGTAFKAEDPTERADWYAPEIVKCSVSAPTDSTPAPPGWFSRADIARTPWALDDLNTVGWAQAARAATALCVSKGANAGHFSGHQDLAKGIFGGLCATQDVVWRDASAQEIAATEWGFTDVNQVTWAQANRAAERLCAGANQGFAGGHFNGQQLDGKYGLVCYRGAAQWFDASDVEIAATGWGFAPGWGLSMPKLDTVQWAQAMRAATGFCLTKGFNGGFMNGHQAPNKYGIVCQK